MFSGLSNTAILRAELRRLFRWLKEKGVTAIITGERGDGASDQARPGRIRLRLRDRVGPSRQRATLHPAAAGRQVSRSVHGTNEYPFLIDEQGISVLPVTSLGLKHEVSSERISTGVARLDAMFGGQGYYRGSSVLVSGTAGSGKTSLAAHFVDAACRRGETCLYFAFEESESQLVRNMRSIGIDLAPWIKQGLLHFHAAGPRSPAWRCT